MKQKLRRFWWVTMWRPSARGRRGQSRSWSFGDREHRRSLCYTETARSRRCRHIVWCAHLSLCIQAHICWYSSSAVTTGASQGRSNSRWLSSRSTASPVTYRFRRISLLCIQEHLTKLVYCAIDHAYCNLIFLVYTLHWQHAKLGLFENRVLRTWT